MHSGPGAGDLAPLLTPKSLAVVGASASPGKLGHTILRNILGAGFPGRVVPVNPRADGILGRPCVASVDDLPAPVDLAVVVVPAAAVPDAIAACGRRRIPAAVVITGGFAEIGGEGARLQGALAEAARRHGVRVLGPNCQGINNPHHGLCASWALLTARGAVAVVSQSGTVGAALMDWAASDGLGVSCFASLGNRVDVDEADLVGALGRDPHTRVIALYLEGIKDPAKFAAAARACAVPLVALKPGRTPRGREAAESHTKSLAGDEAVAGGYLRQLGIHRADDAEDLYDAVRALAYLRRPRGRRLLIVTSSGGCGVMATDAATIHGLVLPPPPPALAEALRAFLPARCILGNPLDLTGDATAIWYRRVLELAAPHYDALAAIFGDPIEGAAEAVGLEPTQCVVFLGGGDVERAERARLHARGIPVFPTPERGIRALARLLPKARVPGSRVPRSWSRKGLTSDGRGGEERMDVTTGRRNLTEPEAFALLEASGLPIVPHAAAATADEAAAAAERLGYPVALKVVSPDILHKTDVGGVTLHLGDAAAVRRAFADVQARARAVNPRADLRGALVAKMAEPGPEVIIGMTRDVQFGPALMFGLGGIFVEIYKDVAFRLPPLSEDDAREMIHEIKGLPLLTGFRGRPPCDLQAILRCLLAVSRLVEARADLEELDLNPVLAYPTGCLVVDAKVVLNTPRLTPDA